MPTRVGDRAPRAVPFSSLSLGGGCVGFFLFAQRGGPFWGALSFDVGFSFFLCGGGEFVLGLRG